jgi:ribonuclease T
MAKVKILSFDLETGGTNAARDGITQAAFVVGECEAGQFREIDTYTAVIGPLLGKNYSDAGLKIQGRTMEDLKRDGIPFNTWRGRADRFVRMHFGQAQQCVAYAYKAEFDVRFLQAHCGKNWCPVPLTAICAMHSFKHWCQVTGSRPENSKLVSACKAIGLDWNEVEAHDALYDARQTAKLVAHLLSPDSWRHAWPS